MDVLNQFKAFTADYKFGGSKSEKGNIDFGINATLERPTLLNSFRQGQPIPFGPTAN